MKQKDVTEETRGKLSLSVRERWAKMDPEFRKVVKKAIKESMKEHWEKYTPEERSAIGKKAAATRKANRAKKFLEEAK